MTGPHLLDVHKLAARLYGADTPATRRRAQRLCASGQLPARQLGKRWVAHIDAVAAFERGDDPARATA